MKITRMGRLFHPVWTVGLLVALGVAPVDIVGQEVGPEQGALVVVGGALQDPDIIRRVIDLAGGPDAPIVVVPTAAEVEPHAAAGFFLA